MWTIRNAFRKGIEHYVQGEYANALNCFQRAAAVGYFPALLCVGFMHLTGESGSENRELAQQSYDQANSKLSTLNKKDRELQYDFGLYHVITKQVQRAEACFKAAATQGHYKAQYRLAMHYSELGRDAEAIPLLEQADQQGYAKAQFQLGLYYFTRRGIEGNLQRAADYFFKAAPQGHLEAQYHLGLCHEEDRHIAEKHHQILDLPEDRTKTNWLQIAVSGGHVSAKQHLEKTSEAKPLPTADAKQVQASPISEVRAAITLDQLFGVEPSTTDNAVQPLQNQSPSEGPISIQVNNAISIATAEQPTALLATKENEKQQEEVELTIQQPTVNSGQATVSDVTAECKALDPKLAGSSKPMATDKTKSSKDYFSDGYEFFKQKKLSEALTSLELAANTNQPHPPVFLLLCELYKEDQGVVEGSAHKSEMYREKAENKKTWFKNNLKKMSRQDREFFSKLYNEFVKARSQSTVKAEIAKAIDEEPAEGTNFSPEVQGALDQEAKEALRELGTVLREQLNASLQRGFNTSSAANDFLGLSLGAIEYDAGMEAKAQKNHQGAVQWFGLAASKGHVGAVRELASYRSEGSEEAEEILNDIRDRNAQRQQAPSRSEASLLSSNVNKQLPAKSEVTGDAEDRSTSRAQDNASKNRL
jgi:hypothetical protein